VIVAVGEGPPEVGQRAVIGPRRHEQIRILGLARGVRRTEDRRTLVVADWLGLSRDSGLETTVNHRSTSASRMTRRPSSPFDLTRPVARPSIDRTSRRVQRRERRPRAHRYSVSPGVSGRLHRATRLVRFCAPPPAKSALSGAPRAASATPRFTSPYPSGSLVLQRHRVIGGSRASRDSHRAPAISKVGVLRCGSDIRRPPNSRTSRNITQRNDTQFAARRRM